jgi:uncharacterized protein (DUF1778 family)
MDTSRSPIKVTSGAPESVQEWSGFRTKSIGTRVTPEELRLIEAAAERDGKKFAEWMREAILKAAAGPPADIGELVLEELAALRYIVPNLSDATARAAQNSESLPPEDVLRIREAADSRKRTTARKLLEEFRASVKPSGGGR